MVLNSVSVKFFLDLRRQRPDGTHALYARIIANRKKVELFLKEFIAPDKWDAARGRLKNGKRFECYLNHKLAEIEKEVNEIKWSLEHKKLPVTAEAIKNIFLGKGSPTEITLLGFFVKFLEEANERHEDYGRSTVQQYNTAKKFLEEFLKESKLEGILLKDFKRCHIDRFENFLLTKVNPKIGKAMGRTSANKYMTRLKTVLLNAIRRELITSNPFGGFILKKTKSKNEFLTQQELDAIIEHPLGENESLKKVRDIFLFSCFTGLRFTDAINLSAKDVKNDESGRLWIKIRQEKTDVPIEVPMLGAAKKIYDKYVQHRQMTGFVLPKISNAKVNAYLKDIARLAGVEKRITHHVARHTFATTVTLENGVDLKTVSKLLGHNSIRSTEIYAKTTKSRMAEVADKLDDNEK